MPCRSTGHGGEVSHRRIQMNVLLVEDDPVQVRLYERLIERLDGNHFVANVSSVEAAFDWCGRREVDLVIVDFHLGSGDDGLEFVSRFRTLYDAETVPVLMVTGDTARDLRLSALTAGATDFLTKPVDIVEFSVRVKNMLALRAYGRQLASRAALLSGEVRKATQAIENREHEIIIRLALVAEYLDPTTGSHIQRMGHLAKCVAEALRLSSVECEMLFDAAPMHDIGKVAVPSSILMKPGPLTIEEFEIVKRHPTVGYEILKDSQSRLVQTAATIALSHHERYDGAGYPHGLAGDEIPLLGRIAAVADVFDALTSNRPYKTAWPIDKAIGEIKRGSGSQFDPKVVEAFLAAVPNLVDIKNRYAPTA